MMKNKTLRNIFSTIILFFVFVIAQADTPPPSSVKAKLHDGSGNPISSTSGSINSKIVSSSGDPVFNSIIFSGAPIDPRSIRALTSSDIVSAQQSGPWTVSLTGSLVLPTGAATEATLATVAKESGGNLESIADDTALVKTAVQNIDSKITTVNTGNVIVASSALPTGAATQATLATRASEATLATRASESTASVIATSVDSIDDKITTTINGIKVDVGGATFTANSDLNDGAGNPITSTVDGAKRRLDVSIQSPLSIEGGNSSAVKVDGSAVTQPISASSLPLPTGAATQTTLAAINTKITTTANGIAVDASATTQPISVSSLPLPTGAATESTLSTRASESTQQTVRDRVTDINNKLNSLGQKTMAGSVPITMASDQGPIAVNGTVAVTGVATEATLSGLNAKIKAYDLDTSGTIENVQGVSIRLPGGTGSQPGGTLATPLRIDPTGTTIQPVNVTGGSISLPAGSATEAKQDAGNASLASIDTDIDVALSTRATESTLSTLNGKVPSGLTVNIDKLLVDNSGQTQPISALSLPLPVGASTSANQVTSNSFLGSIDGKIIQIDTDDVTITSSVLPSGASTEATLSTRASESTLSTLNGKIFSVDLDSGAGTQNGQGVNLRFIASGGSVEAGTSSNPIRMDPTGTTTQPVSVISSSLPSGAATEATLSTRASEATLSSLNSKVTAVDTGNVTVSASALPTGASTAANQTTGNASLASIDGKLNSLGQKIMTGSVPIVIASDQSDINVRHKDGSGNSITSQISGSQRALDVGINVSGTQIDPRSIRVLTSSDVVTANQGTAAATSGAWPMKTTDGTNIQAIKAASTAAVTSDPSAVVALSPNSPLPTGSNAIGTVTAVGNVASGSTDSGNPIKVSGVYNSTAPTFTNGQRGDIQISSKGGLIIAGNAAVGSAPIDNPVSISGVDTSGNKRHIQTDTSGLVYVIPSDESSFNNITTATTTTVKSGAGKLYAICFNKNVNNATVTIYDNTAASGTLIGTITETLGGGADAPKGCSRYNGMIFNTGLTIVTSAATDITVLYK